MKSYLYVITFPEKRVFKIGKADDIRQRINRLTGWWGQPDYENSYHLMIDRNKVHHLEKSLHHMMDEYKVEFDCGDGKTELFSMDVLDIALKYIDVYLMDKPDIKVVKGILAIPNKVPENLSNLESIGYVIKHLRKNKHKTQIEFATEIGIYPRVLKDIETGKGNPTLTSLNKIADALDCKVVFVKNGDEFDSLLP